MLQRIGDALRSGRPLSDGEQAFLTHETKEPELMALGMEQTAAHDIAMGTHPLYGNYDPEVVAAFHPQLFNDNWMNYWGLSKP